MHVSSELQAIHNSKHSSSELLAVIFGVVEALFKNDKHYTAEM